MAPLTGGLLSALFGLIVVLCCLLLRQRSAAYFWIAWVILELLIVLSNLPHL